MRDRDGGWQCGRIRYSVRNMGDEAYLCHCRMCQRATGGFAAAFVAVPRASLTWTTREPDRFRSSPFAQRGFCAQCGTPLTYEGDGRDGLDLTVGSFDDPAAFRPTAHAGVEGRYPQWLDTRALPTQRTDENAHIAQQWIRTLGHIPD